MTIDIKQISSNFFAWREKRKFLFFNYYKTTMLINAENYDEIFDAIKEAAEEKGLKVITL